MDTYKIDILKLSDTLVSQNLKTQEQKYFTISELTGEYLLVYNDFMSLVNSKITIEYNQVFVGEEVVRRFVGIDLEGIDVGNFQEALYDDLSESEKETFDTFYNTFTIQY
jgi:hypothetical protein